MSGKIGLPLSMVELAETLGLQIALSLIQNFGGQDIKWPVRPRPDHPVIKALGERDGLAVCEYLGGSPLYIPHGRPGRVSAARIAALEAAGLDRAGIARALGVSARHVRRVANRSDDPRQYNMDI